MASEPEPYEMAVLYVRIPRPWLERLRQLARERSLPVSAICRLFLRDALYPKRDKAA